jgi:hypothetical protein
MTAPDAASVADEALGRRDEALAALDNGDLPAALALAAEGLALLASAHLVAGLDEAAVLIARAEIEECAGHLDDAAATLSAAMEIIGDPARADDDEDRLALWCQASERLAGLEQLGGEFEAAMARLAAVLGRASAAFGEASLPVVSAANSLGMACKAAGEFDAAAAAYWRAGAALAGLAGPDPLIEAGLLHNLGGLAHARGEATVGIPLAETGLELRTELLGTGHPDVARDLNALGALYQLAERTEDAARAYGRALATFEACYGPDHFEVGMTCANLAVLRAGEGRNAEAESLGQRSLRILQDVLGADDAEVGLTLLNLAAPVAAQGRQAEARALTARASAILAARLPAGHPHTQAAAQALESLSPPK